MMATLAPPRDDWAIAADILDPPNSGYRTDPVSWARDALGVHLWSKQREILESVVENRFTAVRSCHGAGKSFIGGHVLVPWWISVHSVGEVAVVTTAPSQHQVNAILWKEIRRARRKANLRGRITAGPIPEWKIGDELIAFGRKPQDLSDEDEARQAFQGFHARYVLVVLDEACGIPSWLWDAVLSLVTNDDCRVLAIGNPDNPQSRFKEICNPGSNWHVIGISADDTPLFSGEPIPEALRHLLVSPTWVADAINEWGEESPLVESKVHGRFPTNADGGVVPLSWVRRSQVEREWRPEHLLPVELGVDVGAGGDQTVIREVRGVKVGRVWRNRSTDPMRVVAEVLKAIDETEATRVKIDVIGIGWGVAGRLEELRRDGRIDAEIVRVNVGEAPQNPTRFRKLRDEIWWEVGRELSRDAAWDLTGVEEKVVAELIAPKFTEDSSGRIVVEAKDEVRKRIKRSTDDADALLLAKYRGRAQEVRKVAGPRF